MPVRWGIRQICPYLLQIKREQHIREKYELYQKNIRYAETAKKKTRRIASLCVVNGIALKALLLYCGP
jgi:hypothetical protein